MKHFTLYVFGFIVLLGACKKEETPALKPSINFPENGLYGQNIINMDSLHFHGNAFSMVAELKDGADLKIVVSAIDSGRWYYALGSELNWYISPFDFTNNTQEFRAIQGDLNCDLRMLWDSGIYDIKYYENKSDVVSFEKIITVEN